MKPAKFYLGNLEHLKEKYPNINTIKLYESTESADDGWKEIFSESIYNYPTGKDFLVVNVQSDYAFRWYKFEYWAINEDKSIVEKIAESHPTIPEAIGEIVDQLRGWMGDTDDENPAFEDQEYIHAIRSALIEYKGDKNLSYIHDTDVIPIKLLVQIQFALQIAYDHSKYYALATPGAQLNKYEIAEHYTSMAETLQNQYDKFAKRTNREGGGYNDKNIITQFPGIKVSDVSFFSRYTGTFVSMHRRPKYYQAGNYRIGVTDIRGNIIE